MAAVSALSIIVATASKLSKTISKVTPRKELITKRVDRVKLV